MDLTDSHAHLDGFEDLDEVLSRARDAGLRRIVAVGSDAGTLEICRSNPWICAAVAIHPHEARLADPTLLSTVSGLARDPAVVAVGETGLDYHYDHSPRPVQQEVFRRHVSLALEIGKPLVIHSREAMDDTLRILDETGGWAAGGVFHCYSGGPDHAPTILGKGFHLSFAGPVTFRKSAGLRSLLTTLPRGRVLAETDCPYLAPEPHRGRRNEPANVRLVVEAIARAWNVTPDEAAAITSSNAARLFHMEDRHG